MLLLLLLLLSVYERTKISISNFPAISIIMIWAHHSCFLHSIALSFSLSRSACRQCCMELRNILHESSNCKNLIRRMKTFFFFSFEKTKKKHLNNGLTTKMNKIDESRVLFQSLDTFSFSQSAHRTLNECVCVWSVNAGEWVWKREKYRSTFYANACNEQL